jgi:hypothetical protein
LFVLRSAIAARFGWTHFQNTSGVWVSDFAYSWEHCLFNCVSRFLISFYFFIIFRFHLIEIGRTLYVAFRWVLNFIQSFWKISNHWAPRFILMRKYQLNLAKHIWNDSSREI